jgi:ATP-binding cassette subfamily C (CFTR/MRP) protein 4
MDISLNFESGKLYCVIGKIGSAKSSLLQVLSGELPLTSGTIHRGSSAISYAAQEAWIMDGTIRDNIVMGLAFDQEWYDVVVDACALRHDLAQFLNGDETLVGDRGVQCSGGQKARIGLARAFYNKQSDILLLDDPLSAVDARVANTIFFSAIQKLGVGRGKCVILVTHQHQFVGSADQCIVLDGGKVAATGSYEECKAKTTASWTTEIQQTTVDEFESETKLPSEKNQVKWKENQEEKRVTGIVKWDTWKSYLSAFGGYPSCAAFLAVFLVTQVTQLATFVVLGNWAEVRPRDDQNNVR